MKVRYLISDRFGGVSPAPYESLNLALHVGDEVENVQKNRLLFFSKAGVKNAQFANQVHSNGIKYISNFSAPFECDGMITNQKELPLVVLLADCFGVLLFDAKEGVVCALHAGRKGATLGIVEKGIRLMREKFNAKEIEAVITPGIHSCCYEVSLVAQRYPQEFIQRERYLDIKKIIYKSLARGGVEEVKDFNRCTCCDPNYFSYRREKVTGRFGAMIWLE